MPVDRRPYVLGPDVGHPAVLLHGLTGSPWDLRPVADGLAGAGHRVVAPLLPGHDDLETLARTRWREWYEAAERSLVEASARAEGVRPDGVRPDGARADGVQAGGALLLGFSMGSLLALRLAAERPEHVRALILMAVPIELPRWQTLGSRLMVALRARSRRLAGRIGHYPKKRSDVRREAIASLRAALPATPYASIVEVAQLQAEVRSGLARVQAPTLILHGAYDHIAPVEGSARVSQALGASQLRRVILPSSCHHLARDLDRERVRDEILAFARRHAPPRAATVR